MRKLLLALLLVLSPPTLAGDPAPAAQVDVSGWTGVQYNDRVFQIGMVLLQRISRIIEEGRASEDRAHFDAWQQSLLLVIDQGLADLEALPPFKGDPSLRDALLHLFRETRTIVAQTLTELWTLSNAAPPTNETFAALEVLTAKLNATLEAGDARYQAAWIAFAKRHGYRVEMHDAPAVDTGPKFTHPALPPAGSAIDASQHVAFALAYHNAMVDRHGQIITAMNAFMDTSPKDTEAYTGAIDDAVTGLKQIQSDIEAAGDWQGDASLQKPLVAACDDLIPLLEDDATELGDLAQKAAMPKGKIERYNTIVDRLNTVPGAAMAPVEPALEAFRKRWFIDDYFAWARANGVMPPDE